MISRTRPHLAPGPVALTTGALALLLVGAVVLTGCKSDASKRPQDEEATKPSPDGQAACTLETPLKPGIPGSPGNLVASSVNPNGDSELALVMRAMRKDLLAAREALQKGERPAEKLLERHRRILCTWPTEKSTREGIYGVMADDYLAAIKDLDDPAKDPREAYTAAVTRCVNCHEKSCPGPIPAIKRMSLPLPPNP